MTKQNVPQLSTNSSHSGRIRRRRSSKTLKLTFTSLRWGLGLAAILAAFVLLLNFPSGHGSLYLLLGLYALLCLVSPYSWLFLLPALLLSYDLTPWSGRAGLNELDMLVLITLAAGWIRAPSSSGGHFPVLANRRLLLLWLIYLLYLVALALGQGAPSSSFLSGIVYYTPDIAFLQTRGMVYGLLLFTLWIPLYSSDPIRAERSLLVGGCLAALILMVVVIWERGVFNDLFSEGAYYQRLRSLLDFSSTYRITGTLSEMHTGGESIDGALLIVVVISMVAIFRMKGWRQWLALIAFLGGSYALFATFTRTTYAAYSLCVLAYIGLTLVQRRAAFINVSTNDRLVLVGNMVSLLLLGFVFHLSGYIGGLAGGLILIFGLWCAVVQRLWQSGWIVFPIYTALVMLGVYGQLTSKWVSPDISDIIMQTASLVYISALSYQFSRRFRLPFGPIVIAGTAFLFLAVLLASVLVGNRMTVRSATVGADFSTRAEHWNDVIDSMEDKALPLLLGMGKGVFPATYALAYPDKMKDSGGVLINNEDEQSYLRLGRGGDLTLAQRLEVEPGHSYKIAIRARNNAAEMLAVGFCERNLIYASDFMANCVTHRSKLAPSAGNWVEHKIEINSGRVGSLDIWKRWPTVLFLKNTGGGSIEISDIDVVYGASGFSLIKNGSFSEGMDYWYTYNDFEHLSVHMKNIYLALFFEIGLLGLCIVMLLFLMSIKRSFNCAVKGDGFSAMAGLVVVGMLVIGFFGNPLDSVRVSLLFYFIVMISVFTKCKGIES